MAHDTATAADPSRRAVAAGRGRPHWAAAGVDSVGPLQRKSGRQLPPRAVAGVYAAFRDEVARRLPALNAAVAALTRGHNVDLAAAIRDAHTLASSSALLGESSAAAALRQVESGLASPQAERQVHVIAEQLSGASIALSAWLPGSERAL